LRPSLTREEGTLALYLITGVAGFIGSALAKQLLADGHAVRGIDNVSTGSLDNLADCLDDIDFHPGDIRDAATMKRACAGVNFVLHQAAMASVPCSIELPLETHDCNVNGTLNVLLASRDAGVKRVVYAASSSAYGDQPDLVKHEEMCPRPLSPYAVQKLAGEHYMQAFYTVYGLETVCLRYFNIFGPRQAANSPYSGVIARIISVMLDGGRPTIFGDGLQSRDFTFVANAVSANLLACQAKAELVAGRVFNIGTGRSQTLCELHADLSEILGLSSDPIYRPARIGDVQHSLASIAKANQAMGYVPLVDFHHGLEHTVQWYLSQRVLG
jgi:nucleoside-diphosphate-sugar epimerase